MTSTHSVRDLADDELLDGLAAVMTRSRATDAAVLAYLAEVDARGLYLPSACASMHVYCVRVLHMSEDAAFKRITAARIARRFPLIFAAVADGRLHLSAVVMLAPHLTDQNAGERVAAASHRSKRELELLIAAWAPRPDVAERLEALPAPLAGIVAPAALAPGRVDGGGAPPPTTRATPLAPERFALQLTIDRATHDKLERAQALLRHRLPSGDLAQVIDRALDALLDRLVKEKFAMTARPRRRRRSAHAGVDPCAAGGGPNGAAAPDAAAGGPNGAAAPDAAAGGADGAEVRRTRHVPADTRRAVHARDGEQCAFVSAEGVRCTERGFLELDHVDAFAAGGASTPANLRVCCAAHNQHAAELRFGRAFMEAHRRRTPARSRPAARGVVTTVPASSSETAAAPDVGAEVMLGLRGLGVAPADARDALARSAHVPATTLAERLRAALQALRTTYANRSAESPRPWNGDARTGPRPRGRVRSAAWAIRSAG